MTIARIGTALIVFVIILLTSCVKRQPEQQAELKTKASQQTAAPARWTGDAVNFTFTTADGKQRTADSYAGKPLVLNFWAAW